MKAQASAEYFIIVAVALLILAPIILYANQTIASSQEELKISTARNAVDRIGEAADLVYTQGSPAKTTMTIFIPDNVNYTLISNKTVQITLRTSAGRVDVYKETNAPLNGSLPNQTGFYPVSITAFNNYVNISVVK